MIIVANSLSKARGHLEAAKQIMAIGLSPSAAREAYAAAYHAAQAYIFFKSGKVAKTHSGVRSEFARLSREDAAIPRELTTFLAHGYELKSTADYGVDSDADVSSEEAESAIASADQFVHAITEILKEE